MSEGKGPVRLMMTFDIEDREKAEVLYKALRVDDDDYISTSIDGEKVLAEVRANDVSSARRAADDWMACLISVLKDL